MLYTVCDDLCSCLLGKIIRSLIICIQYRIATLRVIILIHIAKTREHQSLGRSVFIHRFVIIQMVLCQISKNSGTEMRSFYSSLLKSVRRYFHNTILSISFNHLMQIAL
ncbi:hypothetical protein D3C76_1333870 [compost metagenome]